MMEQAVHKKYPAGLYLKKKTNSSITETSVLALNLSKSNGIVSTKIYDKRDDFDFEKCKFPV